jgi:hypothetical protein
MLTNRIKEKSKRAPTLMMIVGAAVSLAGCNEVRAAPESPAPRAELVVLADGTTMVARKGTLSRDLADWLAGDGAASRDFTLGSDSFHLNSAKLSPAGLGRAVDLGTLLRATPGATLTLSAIATPNDPLADERAATLEVFLAERGLLKGQVRVAPAEETVFAAPIVQPGTLALRLSRATNGR